MNFASLFSSPAFISAHRIWDEVNKCNFELPLPALHIVICTAYAYTRIFKVGRNHDSSIRKFSFQSQCRFDHRQHRYESKTGFKIKLPIWLVILRVFSHLLHWPNGTKSSPEEQGQYNNQKERNRQRPEKKRSNQQTNKQTHFGSNKTSLHIWLCRIVHTKIFYQIGLCVRVFAALYCDLYTRRWSVKNCIIINTLCQTT